MRIYELVFIIKPDIPEEEVDAAIALVEEAITSGRGVIDKTDKWGKKPLAYRVQKYREGVYVLIQYSLSENLGLPKEIERRMGVADAIIKYMTVRIDEDLKRAAKRQAMRDKRIQRRPAPQERSAPGPASGGGPGQPAAPAPAPAPAPDPTPDPAPAPAEESKEGANASNAASDQAKD